MSNRLYPDFEHRDPDTLAAKVREALEEYRTEVSHIRSIPEAEADFANTVLALEKCGEALELASSTFFNLLSCDADDRMMELSQELTMELTEVSNEISMDLGLAQKVRKIYESDRSSLDPQDHRLLYRSYEGYKNRGAYLTEDVRTELKSLRKELSLATLNFGQNVLKEQNAYRLSLIDGSCLKRLPAAILEQAKKAAEEAEIRGWLFGFSMPEYLAIMKYCDCRTVREKMYRDHGKIGYDTAKTTKNTTLVYEIVRLRTRIANLLGHDTYADYILEDRMAKSPTAVYSMLDQLRTAYLPLAQKEVEDIRALAEKEGLEGPLQPWDWSYYAELYRQKELNYDEEETRPYFGLNDSVRAMFGLAGDLYGLTFAPNDRLTPYRPGVEVYDVLDGDELMGTLLMDYHPRKGKQSGAWMTNYVEAHDDVRPVVSLVMNFTPATADKPALLTIGEVNTMFHEFGHALHGLLTRVRHASLSGTNVVRDFVELPSQLMENWLLQPEFLKSFGKHYATGEVLPDHLVEAIRRSNHFLDGYACIRQLGFGYLDMAWHDTPTDELPKTIKELEEKVNEPIRLLPTVEGVATSTAFGHIFSGGYAAGYYGYKWSEILDADAFEEYLAKGLRDKDTASRFRKEILERGDADEPEVLYKNFKGRPASIEALFRRDQLL